MSYLKRKAEEYKNNKDTRYQTIANSDKQIDFLNAVGHDFEANDSRRPNIKFLPGLVRLVLEDEIGNNEKLIRTMKSILSFIVENNYNDYDENLNNLSFSQLQDVFEPKIEELSRKTKENLKNKKFTSKNYK
ncbi:MAG: hypothetical protein HUJ68_01130, partial [Clostridia bacterium]|nr:hypothetical protein [Clostridia bacterium]